MDLEPEGYAIVPEVFTPAEIERLIAHLPEIGDAAGTRTLLNTDWGRELANSPTVRALVDPVLGPRAVATRGILFDKTGTANWSLGWHQDKKIAVQAQVETVGFAAWSVKEGVVHCQPPAELLEQCLAVRIHLDPCGVDNGPLRVIPGSHRSGYIEKDAVALITEAICVCEPGDVLLMRPLLLHRSYKSESVSHRRVIHIEYCAAQLPEGMQWAFSAI